MFVLDLDFVHRASSAVNRIDLVVECLDWFRDWILDLDFSHWDLGLEGFTFGLGYLDPHTLLSELNFVFSRRPLSIRFLAYLSYYAFAFNNRSHIL